LRLKTRLILTAFAAAAITASAHAQAGPTAARPLEISAFAGLTGTFTGLSGGKNLGITAGADIGIRSYHGFRPFLEGRGTYPIDDGHIDAQKDAIGGIRVEHPLLRPNLRLYGDFLIGRGEIDYLNGGYPSPSGDLLYLRSTSTVLSPGAGLQYRLTDHFSALVDGQFQHWDTPASPSGSIWAKAITVGTRYTFNFNRHGYAVGP
jgi:hypothetical protein